MTWDGNFQEEKKSKDNKKRTFIVIEKTSQELSNLSTHPIEFLLFVFYNYNLNTKQNNELIIINFIVSH